MNRSDDTTATIYVGPELWPCKVNRELICRYSPYFKHAFQGRFVEAERREITLSDVDPKVFEVFVYWAYSGCPDWTEIEEAENGAYIDGRTGKLLPRQLEDAPRLFKSYQSGKWMLASIPLPGKKTGPSQCQICHLEDEKDAQNSLASTSLDVFIFADKYDVPVLRRESLIARQLYDEIHNIMPQLSTIIQAYEALPPSSPFCKYCAQRAAYMWKSLKCDKGHEETDRLAEQLPPTFTFAVMKMLSGKSWRFGRKHAKFPCETKHQHPNRNSLKECPSFIAFIGREERHLTYNWCTLHEHTDDKETMQCRAVRVRPAIVGEAEAEWIMANVLFQLREIDDFSYCNACYRAEWVAEQVVKCDWCQMNDIAFKAAEAKNRILAEWKKMD